MRVFNLTLLTSGLQFIYNQKGMIIVTVEEFRSINTLSEKILSSTATTSEIDKFNELVTIWCETKRYNLMRSLPEE